MSTNKTMSSNKTVSSNSTVSIGRVSTNNTMSCNKPVSSNSTMSIGSWGNKTVSSHSTMSIGSWGSSYNTMVVVLSTSMDWDWVGHWDWLCIWYLYWDSHWLGNGSWYLDFLDLRLSVLDNGTGMEGSINKVGNMLVYIDLLSLDSDLWGIVGYLREQDRGRGDGRGRQGRLVDGCCGPGNIGLCAVVSLLVDGDCHMLLGDGNFDLLRGKGNSILLWSGLDNMLSYSDLGSLISNYSMSSIGTMSSNKTMSSDKTMSSNSGSGCYCMGVPMGMGYSNIMRSTQSDSNHAEKYQILHDVLVE